MPDAALQSKAAKGDARAEYQLGMAYLDSKADAAGAEWIHASARQGYAPAEVELGKLYGVGRGIGKNYVEAYFWIKLANSSKRKADHPGAAIEKDAAHQLTRKQIASANRRVMKWKPERGNVPALALALPAVQGNAVKPQISAARTPAAPPKPATPKPEAVVSNMPLAALQPKPIPPAPAAAVATTPEEKEVAAVSLRAAKPAAPPEGNSYADAVAMQDDPYVQQRLGLKYEEEGNYAEAWKYYLKAAGGGDASTQAYIGSLYRQGKHVKRDYEQAYFWLTLASSRTNEENVSKSLWKMLDKERSEAALHLSRDKIVEIEKRVDDWAPAKTEKE